MSARSSQSIPEAALGSHGGYLEQALHHLHHPLVLGRGGGSEGPSTGPHTTHDSHVAGPMSNPTSTVSAVSQREEAPSSIFFHYPLCRGNVPPARWAHAAAAVGSVLWVYGGVGNSVLDDLCALDSESLAWRNVGAHAARSKDRPEKMLGHAMAASGTKLWLFGGQQGRKFLRSLFCLDTETCTWTRAAAEATPPARAGHAMATVHGNVVYMFGGQGKKLYNDLYKLDPVAGNFVEVEAAGKPPPPRRGHSLVWDGRDYLVCFGGINQSSTDSHLSVFSLSRGQWFTPQAFGPMPSPRTQHSAVLLSPGIILIFGGCNSAGTFFNDATVLDTRTFTWTRPSLLNTVPAPRYHHTCNVLNGRILIYGGINSKQTFDGVVVVETKFLSDITSVAEELFRMSADTGMSLPGPSPRAPPSQISFTTPIATPTHQGQAQQQQQLQQQQQHTQQQQQQQPVMVVPGPMVSTAECLLNSAKSLESVKVQLTDLLLRRNLEEQQIQTARKAENTETLLAKEREAREAAAKELLQYRLLLAEAEADRNAAQQQLQASQVRATREAAATAELRGQVEALQAKLAAREEELQEARLLQDGLVKELGIMASRYSRLAMDVQDAGGSGQSSSGRGSAAARGSGSSGGPPSLHPGMGNAARGHTEDYPLSTAGPSMLPPTMLSETGTVGSDVGDGRGAAELEQSYEGQGLSQAGASASRRSSMLGPPRHAAMAALSAQCTAAASGGEAGAQGGAPNGCSNCCSQLLMLLSESEVHRSQLMDANHSLSEKVEDLAKQKAALQGQLQQFQADAAALESLNLGQVEELERKLEASARLVREVLMRRKIEEAHRRTSSEQAQCAVCMESAKAVVFNCGHQSCEPCSTKLTNCPFCRVAITARIRLFDA